MSTEDGQICPAIPPIATIRALSTREHAFSRAVRKPKEPPVARNAQPCQLECIVSDLPRSPSQLHVSLFYYTHVLLSNQQLSNSPTVHEYTSTRVHEYTSSRVHEYTSRRVNDEQMFELRAQIKSPANAKHSDRFPLNFR